MSDLNRPRDCHPLDQINHFGDQRKLFSAYGELFFNRKGKLVAAIQLRGSEVIVHRPGKEPWILESRLFAISQIEKEMPAED